MQENAVCEFKREFTNNLNKEVIAFANTEGGKIFLGIILRKKGFAQKACMCG